MKYTKEQEFFINNYVKALKENNAVVFIGAGMSVSEGYFDWKKLLKPVADSLDLDITEENDLSALAQFFVDDKGGVRGHLDQILTEEYAKINLVVSENHRILTRMPINTYWTTNYDKLIEEAFRENKKTPDVKKAERDLTVNLPKRDAIIYKMHGDINTVSETVLTKHDYEDYNSTRELFSNTFKSDFVAKTFLFIGFSFTDPNLDFLISRIRTILGKNVKPDYYFIKKDEDVKKQRRQELKVNSLKRYGLYAIYISDYSEITKILKEIEVRFSRNTILISGSAETYGEFGTENSLAFLHDLSKEISKKSYKILSGFGWGVGSAIINGVLDNMETELNQNLDNYLILRPFPQFETNGKNIKKLWTEYRNKFIPLAGICLFVFGNKKNKKTGDMEIADGMEEEFEIAILNGLKVIPIGATGFVAKKLWQKVIDDYDKYYPNNSEIKVDLIKLGETNLSNKEIISITIGIIEKLNKK